MSDLLSRVFEDPTERQLLGQSVTAERQAAMKRWAPSSGGGMPGTDILTMAQGAALGDPSGGVATAVGRRAFNALTDRIRMAASNRLASGTANALVGTGPDQQAILDQIARARNPLLGPYADPGVNLALQAAAPGVRNRLAGH